MKRYKASDKKKMTIDLEVAEHLKSVPSPSIKDILPIAIIRGTYNLAVSIPGAVVALWTNVYSEVEKVQKEKRELKGLLLVSFFFCYVRSQFLINFFQN